MHMWNLRFTLLIILVLTIAGCAFGPNASRTDNPTSEPGGFDCSSVQSLPPDSPEAQTIVADFIADYREAYPTEYMGFYQLRAVDKYEDYVVLQGMATQEETNVILIQKTPGEYVIVSQFFATGGHPITRKTILDYFEKELRPDLFRMMQCISFD